MTAIEALTELQAIARSGDPEVAHSRADDVLVAFLKDHDPACADIAKAFEAARNEVGFWYA